MKKINKIIENIARFVTDQFMGSGLSQEETKAEGSREVMPGMPALIRKTAAESCVLLKNNGALPINAGNSVAVFGRCQYDWFYVGYGSGGDVHSPYYIDLIEGMDNAGVLYDKELALLYHNWVSDEKNKAEHGWWGHWPYSHPEMPLDEKTVSQASQNNDIAIVVIGRAAGEERDNKLEKGSYYLTDEELRMLDIVTESFKKVIVLLNTGNIIDMSWLEKYGDRILSVLIVWLGGMESGNAVCDVLLGKINPCGKLPDSIAVSYEDYPSSINFGGKKSNNYEEGIFLGYRYFDLHPEKVLFSFGFGLSYTKFKISKCMAWHGCVYVFVKNIGKLPGREVLQLYCAQPEKGLTKPKRVLVAFEKTKEIKPGRTEIVTLRYDDRAISVFDEKKHAFVLEKGKYRFSVNGKFIHSFTLRDTRIIQQCEVVCDKEVLKNRIMVRLPRKISSGKEQSYSFEQLLSGECSVNEFIGSLSNDDLEALSRGHGMFNSPLGIPGNAGTFGGVTQSLRDKKVPVISCCDGPAGLRMQRYCSLLPCGTALAATWNVKLVQALHTMLGHEMTKTGADILLSPGMNLHRNPLCGRNFEYFSEDPLLSGKMGVAVVNGVQSTGRGVCPKHFLCNNQEEKRNTNDSVVDEKTLRELYLRNFEICVREASPLTIMTSYNKINGVWSHYNYDMVTTVLRNEWGFKGAVMTDWWMKKSKSPEFPELEDNAYRVRAQVDLLMPGSMRHFAKDYKADSSLLKTLGQPDGITIGELQRTARNVIGVILQLTKARVTEGSLDKK